MKVIKRDGRIVEYDREKIVSAIMNAFEEVDADMNSADAIKISNSIADFIENKNKDLSVEEIQDAIESRLMASKRKDVAKSFIIYRNNRTLIRESQSDFIKKVYGKVNATDIENSNANVNEHSFSGREKEAGSILGKHMAVDLGGLSKEVSDAHKNMLLYQHDLDKAVYGFHNCLNLNFQEIFNNGFSTRNGDVRIPSSFSTACQQVAVAFQCQSQVQFGGVGTIHLDYDLAPFVKNSFVKAFITNIIKQSDDFNSVDIESMTNEEFDKLIYNNKVKYLELYGLKEEDIYIDNKDNLPINIFNMAYFDLLKEGKQAAQGLYHNLNTLESRQGSQLPFTSINVGRDTSTEGRLVTKWILDASIDGIGKYHLTSIFPISIFQYKVGTNANPGDKNYDLKQLALKSMAKRIYPNWTNGDWSQAHEDENNPDTFMSTMG